MTPTCNVRAALPRSAETAFGLAANAEHFPSRFRGYWHIPSIRSITRLSPWAVGCMLRGEARWTFSAHAQGCTVEWRYAINAMQRCLDAVALEGAVHPSAETT